MGGRAGGAVRRPGRTGLGPVRSGNHNKRDNNHERGAGWLAVYVWYNLQGRYVGMQ